MVFKLSLPFFIFMYDPQFYENFKTKVLLKTKISPFIHFLVNYFYQNNISHFLNLIGNETKETNPNLSIKYVSSESFINELIMSIQKNRTFSFREKYRDLDVLLFDDFQFLENKKTCQEEFIHTYESITKRGGKIIIAANKNISELKNLNPKLSSIIKSGLVTTIEEPNEEDKNKLIDFKIKELKNRIVNQLLLFVDPKSYQLQTHC